MVEIYCCERNLGGSQDVRQLLSYAYSLRFGGKMPDIEKDENGKPFFPARPDIHFSLSHSKTHVLCAIADCPVGADIETIREISPHLRDRVCSPEENLDFFKLWTLKESFIKLRGKMDRPYRQMKFVLRDGAIIPPDPAVRAAVYDTVPGCAAAVCACCRDLPNEIITVPPKNLITQA
jgi:phosphopantetheinyl transferase